MNQEPTKSQSLSRRGFLQNSAAGVAAATWAGTMWSSAARAQETPERKLGYAMVGLGSFAMRQLLPSFAQCKSSKVVALVSGDPDKAKAQADRYNVDPKNIYNYENYDTLKDNPEVDVIYIVLPNGMHAEYTIRGFKAGKHVMCEKPMANTPQECEQMIAAGKEAGKKLMIGYRSQFEPNNLEAIRIVQSGEIGKVATFVGDAGFRIFGNPWRLNKKLAGGGPLMDIGIYALQGARYILGEEPIEVSATAEQLKDDQRFAEVESSLVWQMKFPSGVLANCSTSYVYASQNRFRVMGLDGHVDLDPATNYNGNKLFKRIWRPGAAASRTGTTDVTQPEINQFAAEMDHLSESILANTEPKTPGEEGLRDLKIMMAIYEAAASGKTVKL